MLESILIGLLTSGIYYITQQDRDAKKEKDQIKTITKKEIEATLEHGFQTLFPGISKKISSRIKIDPTQLKLLNKLLFDWNNELEFELKNYFEKELLERPLSSEGQRLDIISIQAMEKTLLEINKRKEIKGLDREFLTDIVPQLVVEMLFQIERHPGLKEYADVIRRIQDGRYKETIFKELILDETTTLSTIKERRRRQIIYSYEAYVKKLHGIWFGAGAQFKYVSPSLSLILRDKNNCIPLASEWESHKKEISFEEFIDLLLKDKLILLVAGAGVGKTTFMHLLHLELLCDHIKDLPLPIFEETRLFIARNGDLIDRVSAYVGAFEKKGQKKLVLL